MVTIGVTGHRVLTETDRIEVGLESVVDRLEQTYPEAWTIVSALAEGADRLVARRMLARGGTRLVAVLPLPPHDYEADFATDRSKEEFRDLLSRADEVMQVPPQPNRGRAYEAGGHIVLDFSNVLVAVWDGQPAQGLGGTADIVSAARQRDIALAWVHAGNRAPGSEAPTTLGPQQGSVTFEHFPSTRMGTHLDATSGATITEDDVRGALQDKFRLVSAEGLDLMLARGFLREHQAQDLLCHQGEREDLYSVVISGQLDVYITHETSRAFVACLPEGGSLGGLEYLTQTARAADVVATGPVVTFDISFGDLDEIVRSDPEVLREISHEIVTGLLESQATFMALSGPTQDRESDQEIFVSYARADVQFAKRLASGLLRFGVAAWLDVYNIRAGISWARQIGEALDRCRAMILVISPASMSSENSDDEWNYFLDKKRPVIPVLLEQTERPYRLNKLQYVDFSTQPFDTALTQLVVAIRNAIPTHKPRAPQNPSGSALDEGVNRH